MMQVYGLGYTAPELRPDQLTHNGTDTSRAAAASMVQHAPAIRARILDFITSRGVNGASCDEIEQELGISHQCSSARLTELRKNVDVIDMGERRVTRSGRKAIVWVSTRGGGK